MAPVHALGLEPDRICGLQVRAQDHLAGELGWARGCRRRRAGSGTHQGKGVARLALGERDEREDAVTHGDQHVIPLPHPDQQRVGGHGRDGETVAVGDGEPVTAERDPERGVRGRIDQAQLGPLSGLGGQGHGRGGDAPVGQVVRIDDVAGTAQQRRRHALPHAAHVHAAHAAHPAARGRGEVLEDVIGGAAGAIDPVVEHHGPLDVVAAGVGLVVDQQGPVQAAVDLDAGMGVVEVGAGVRDGELVGEGLACPDRGLGDSRHPVHVVAQGDAVPVHAGCGRQLVVHLDPQQIAGPGPQQRSWHRVAVGPGVDHWTAEVDRDRSWRQLCGDHTLAGAAAQRLGTAYGLGAGRHGGRAPAGADRREAGEPEGTDEDVSTGQL